MKAIAQEKALTFGEGKRLVGIATLPQEPVASRPAVLFLNAGLIHHVGPFRMHVDLARLIAERGFLSLRLDQSGLGDSQPRPGDLSYEERAVLDAREAMDALTERYDVKSFVLVGLCAGAMSAHRVAVADKRVVGACLLDGYAYRTPTYHLFSGPAKIARPAFWRMVGEKTRRHLERVFLRQLRHRHDAAAPDSTAAPLSGEEQPGQGAAAIFAQDWPPQPVVARELDDLLVRGVRMLFVYTGGWSDFVHSHQFDEMFPDLARRDRAEVEFYRNADHTYLVLEHREKMSARVEKFISSFK